MSCFGETVYSSLAQLSVKGQADSLLDQHKVGMIDVFTSAFYTHPTFAAGFIRCGELKTINQSTGGVQIFQPPRSFDVVHDCFLVVELPGLIQTATDAAGRVYEVLADDQKPKVVLTAGAAVTAGNELANGSFTMATSADYGAENQFSPAVGATFSDGTNTFTVQATGLACPVDLANGQSITLESTGAHASHVNVADEHLAHYKYAAGQWLVQKVQLEIGGSLIDELSAEYLFIHEELHGTPGRRLEDSIMKIDNLASRSTVRQRLYVPLCFWFSGGDLSRALMTIAMQLHRIDFRVEHRSMDDLIYSPATITTPLGDMTSKVSMRKGEVVNKDARSALSGEVRNGGNAAHFHREALTDAASAEKVEGVFGMEFHGVFLNTATRSQYVNLNTQQLFYTVTERSFQTTGQGTQQQTLDFKNAVFEIIVAVRNGIDTGNNMRNPWRFEGTAADSITGERDDALRSLEFSLSSTPRTLTNLEAQYYRLVYPFMFAETMSDLKGLYYYPLKTREYLNGTRIVNGYINASKIDDLRVRYNVNDAAYSSSMDSSETRFYARAWNLLSIKNSMAGKLFQ